MKSIDLGVPEKFIHEVPIIAISWGAIFEDTMKGQDYLVIVPSQWFGMGQLISEAMKE